MSLRQVLVALTAAAFLASAPVAYAKDSSKSSSGSHAVKGYTTKEGTKVAPHKQTNPDHNTKNNYTTKGNVNPGTGKVGTVDPNKKKKG